VKVNLQFHSSAVRIQESGRSQECYVLPENLFPVFQPVVIRCGDCSFEWPIPKDKIHLLCLQLGQINQASFSYNGSTPIWDCSSWRKFFLSARTFFKNFISSRLKYIFLGALRSNWGSMTAHRKPVLQGVEPTVYKLVIKLLHWHVSGNIIFLSEFL
jgi:hypothetical protein